MKLQPDQQNTCLTQSGGQSLLDDGHAHDRRLGDVRVTAAFDDFFPSGVRGERSPLGHGIEVGFDLE